MNKNLFIYSFKYLAVLLALVTFSSCERDEFTEQDALELQQAQLQEQRNRDSLASEQQNSLAAKMMWERRKLDSLTRANAGGKVYYSVSVVPGGASAFSTGRFEEIEGVSAATVTVSQFGAVVSTDPTSPLNGRFAQTVETGDAGVASFELYSGEATVHIDFADETYTPVSYVVNLTPDGGVANGANTYVGNVIPVFADPLNARPEEADEFAIIKGFAFAETDIRFDNNEEEPAVGAKVRAFIDVNPAFMAKYINEANGLDEGTNINGNTTKSGLVQRIAYQKAVSTTDVTALADLSDDPANPVTGATQGGAYSITMAATASGLPIKMKFDDFAANRQYVFGDEIANIQTDGDFGSGSKRFLYTQNTEMVNGMAMADPTPFFTGTTDLAANYTNLEFSFVETPAQAEATIAGGDRVSSIAVLDGGYYYEAPTVTVAASATGVAATAVANLVDIDPAATGDAAAARTRGLKKVGTITVTSGGSGYTSAPAVTFTRKSYTGRVGGIPVANGTGSVAAPSSSITYIRIMNGGFGMTPAVAAGTAVTGVGAYTGVAPGVVFNNNIVPTGGALATANAIVDETVGTVTEVQVTNGGDGYDDANLNITFNYGERGVVNQANAGDALFVVDATGALNWNTGGTGTRTLNMAPPATSPQGEVAYNQGGNYTFVPSVTVTGLTPPAGATAPTFVATVTDGLLTSIEIQGATSGWGAAGAEFGTAGVNININANPDAVNVSAEGFTQGGSIDSYILTNYGTSNNVYQATVEAAGETFNYLTTLNDGSGTIVDGTGTAVAPADFAANSDFIVVFENPTAAGGTNAWGYPIFDNSGGSLVGMFFVNQGIGYTNAAPATYNFWVIPADLDGSKGTALAEYAGLADGGANANARAALNASNLTITFPTPGAGYAVRPEFRLSGGNKSFEDLAGINTAINTAIRSQLTFDASGAITNPALVYTGALPFTAADLATSPLTVDVSVERLENEFNAEVNSPMLMANGNVTGTGILARSNDAGTQYATLEYYLNGTQVPTVGPVADDMATRVSGLPGTYITAPKLSARFGTNSFGQGVATTTTATGALGADATLDGFTDVSLGQFPSGAEVNGVTLTSFFYQLNDPSYNPNGERFRTIGGPSSFDVYSGMTYIRDVNYGTGIELE